MNKMPVSQERIIKTTNEQGSLGIQAAKARIAEMPAKPTLVDEVSDAIWHEPHNNDNINAGR